MQIRGPKEKRAFIFYIVATLCMWEFGNSLRRVFTTDYFLVSFKNDPFVSFVLTKNTGGAFSILPQYTVLLAILGIFAVIATGYYVYRYVNFKDRLPIIASVLFSGGILGNAFERLKFGHVIDYIKLNFVDFAIFNMFDVMICAAVVLFVCFMLRQEFSKKIRGGKK